MLSTSCQHFFTLSAMLNDLFKCPRHRWSNKNNVECMLKQMLNRLNGLKVLTHEFPSEHHSPSKEMGNHTRQRKNL